MGKILRNQLCVGVFDVLLTSLHALGSGGDGRSIFCGSSFGSEFRVTGFDTGREEIF